MCIDNHPNRIDRINPRVRTITSDQKGNILVYLIVVILIFGVLGVSLVSLFTTATGSSATPNDAKRARYIAESGIRYALSEIRNSDDLELAAELLNTTPEFKLGKNGGFTAEVFSPGLKSAQNKTIFGSGTLTLDAPYSGEFPDDFSVHNATSNVYIVDWLQFPGTTTPPNSDLTALVIGSTDARGAPNITVNLNDDYDADLKDTVCFALLPTDAGTISRGNSIYVNEKAIEFFPSENGAIRIVTLIPTGKYNYFYEKRIHDTANNRVELTNVREMPGDTWTDVGLKTTDYVILSPFNFRVFASGTSDQTTVEVGRDRPFWALAVPSEYTIYMRELLQDKEINQFGDVIRAPPAGGKIDLGAGGGGSEGFGDLWYSGEKTIGGDTDRCKVGRCIFNEGIRTFFTVRLSGDGEGFTFALLGGGNAADTITPVNSTLSAGGDVDASELLGYAGDSRSDSAGTAFVDDYTAIKPPGLLPPKMAVEFDTRTNLNEPLQYCAGTDLNENTRNDPMPEGKAKDVMQYVFWGNETLAISCRGDGETYDDNRHNAEGDEKSPNWAFDTKIAVQSSPTFDPTDESLYFGTNENPTNNFYALKSGGALRWRFNPGDSSVRSKPALDTDISGDRIVYFSTTDAKIYKLKANPSGTIGEQAWGSPLDVGGAIHERVSPVVNKDHNIYIGSTNENFYAYESDKSTYWVKDLGDNIEASAAVDNNTDSSFYGRVYVGKDDDDEGVGRVFAFDPNSIPPETPKWSFQTVEDIQSTPAISKDGSVVYAVDDTGLVYAINNSTDIAIDGTEKWSEPTDLNKTVDYISPAVDTSDSSAAGTIYVATNDGNLFAIDPDGTKKPAPWPIFLGSTITYSSPAVGPDGVIYIGTDDGIVHAVNPDGTEKWVGGFPTGGAVQSSPEIDDDGVVYIGSDDNKVYAIATAALPRNFRNDHPDFHEVPVDFRSVSFYPISQKAHITDDDIEAGADIDSENDWLNGGSLLLPWAVRIEVEKIAAQTYELKTWIRQCTIGDCSDIKNTLFQDTERKYDYSPLIYPGSVPPIKRQPLVQTITLTAAEDEQFERVLFGFTTAAKSGDSQLITVRDFQLTFIETAREDVAVFDDPNWP